MANPKATKTSKTGLKFSTALGDPETKRKLLLYRELLRQEMRKELEKPRVIRKVRVKPEEAQAFATWKRLHVEPRTSIDIWTMPNMRPKYQ
ncbi:uncharacterized protein LOC115630641 [Scaptodrosophila lebanonensis]|uniref:Uncharacterized protein LOC115630641 n=1 Tax=Drosophila lebanonensis TaxID=7225 RepID=A0A6J2U3C4_DROLE|nr:uncharacterized protein LOC115630641 [Scaptodrosophila lebanonensis]